MVPDSAGESAMAGLLTDPAGASLGLPLPVGEVVVDPAGAPWFWLSADAPGARIFEQSRAAHRRTGLWPILLGDHPSSFAAAPDLYPHLSGHLSRPPNREPTAPDLDAWTAAEWARVIAENETSDYWEPEEKVSALAPAGAVWPGPAPAGVADVEPLAAADRVLTDLLDKRSLSDPRLALVPGRSGIEALSTLGWWPSGVSETAPFVPMMQSWEHRFGTRVVALQPDTLIMSVAAPPTTIEHALHVTAEHLVFCPDVVFEASESYLFHAQQLVGATRWAFWWD